MMFTNIKRGLCALIALGALGAPLGSISHVYAQVTHKDIYVDDSASTNGNGAGWNTPYKYLQDSLADAASFVALNPNDNTATVHLAQGTYKPDQGTGYTSGNRSHSFVMVKRTRVKGGYAGPGTANPDANDPNSFVTTLSGNIGNTGLATDNSYTVVKFSDSNISYNTNGVIEGLTITGGFANDGAGQDSGGGVRITNGAAPRLHQCRIANNFAGNSTNLYSGGAGVYVNAASPVLTHCTIEFNEATANFVGRGGGLLSFGASTVRLIDCTIRNNTKVLKGGGVATVSTVAGNELIMTNCLVRENAVAQCAFCPPTLPAHPNGGGIYVRGSTTMAPIATIVNCTIVKNNGLKNGGGVQIDGGIQSSITSTLQNCIVWDNGIAAGQQLSVMSADDKGLSQTGLLKVRYSNVKDRFDILAVDGTVDWADAGQPDTNIGENVTAHNPNFISASNFRLNCGSACINAGNPIATIIPADDFDLNANSYTSTERTPDLDVLPRVIGFDGGYRVDMGAYETQPQTSCTLADIVPLPCRDQQLGTVSRRPGALFCGHCGSRQHAARQHGQRQ